jgi:threonine/homoserine/homoserine lactone efflux protein
MLSLLAQGAALGLWAAASPGPFQAFLSGHALRQGVWRALPAALAPLLSDGPIIAVVLSALVRAPPGLLRALNVAGGLFLLGLAWSGLRAGARAAPGPAAPSGALGGIGQAVVMNALSPGPWIFWSLVCGPILASAWAARPAGALAFLLGFYAVLCLGNAALVVLFAGARQLGPGVARALALASAVALLAFGLHQLWRGTWGWAGAPGA